MNNIYKTDIKIRKLLLPILTRYELSFPDMVVLCKYRVSKDITRDLIMRALLMSIPIYRIRYCPYRDSWRPDIKVRIERKEYINSIPKIIRRLIADALDAIIRDETMWRKRHLYKAYRDEMVLT